MSLFSDLLEKYLKEKGMKVYQLSKVTGIERTNLFRISKGTRKAQAAMLPALAAGLRLAPDESDELTRAFEITRVGESLYRRREAVNELICSFHNTLDSSKYSVALNPTVQTLAPAYHGKYNVQQIIKIILDAETTAENAFVKMNVPPEHEFLMGTVQSVSQITPSMRIEHIFCFENSCGEENDTTNIILCKQIISLLLSCDHYEPRYFYGNVKERFSRLAAFSNLLITSQYALLFSEDEQRAILLTDAEQIQVVTEFFNELKKISTPIVQQMKPPPEHTPQYHNYDCTQLRLSQNLCIYLNHNSLSIIYLHPQKGTLSFCIEEPFLVKAVYDYLSALEQTPTID